MESLQKSLSEYVNVSKKLTEVNAVASKLREERNLIELDLAAEYAHPREPLPAEIKLDKSKMVFTVKKPGEWKKGWTLSRKQLTEYVMEILPEHGEDLLREINRRHEPKLRGDDFQFDLKAFKTSE
jgi:hypothetical protein